MSGYVVSTTTGSPYSGRIRATQRVSGGWFGTTLPAGYKTTGG